MSILLNNTLPGFDDPLAMLQACHDRIEAHCATLEKLVEYLPLHGCDSAARQAAGNILRYFDTAGLNHHADEERDLFPLLRASSHGPEAVELAALLESLMAEHRLMEQAWQDIRAGLVAITTALGTTLDKPAVTGFTALYRSHLETENSRLLPLANALLTPAQLASLGETMAARRQTGTASSSDSGR